MPTIDIGSQQSAMPGSGNSTVTLQSVVDYVSTIGDLNPVLAVSGYSSEPALTIANDVIQELLSQRFNWKFNRVVIKPFATNSWQMDYALLTTGNIGWLECACRVDINNPMLPKPLGWMECVRDLERTSAQNGWPEKICWLYNEQLVNDWPLYVWPGAGKTYTNPIGAATCPANPPTNIVDANGNILVLAQYGVTGATAPVRASGAAAGTQIADGTCIWQVADARGQGFRVSPLPPQAGRTWQIHVIAQARPRTFTSLQQALDPLPDDYAKFFRDGFIAYCHRHSSAPLVRNRFAQMREQWLMALVQARGAGDRERDDAGFVPARSIMSEPTAINLGPAWPFGPYGTL